MSIERILKYIEENGPADSLKLAGLWNEDHQNIVGLVKSLQCLGDVVETEMQSTAQLTLTAEGKAVIESGSHEALVFNAIPDGGIPQNELMAKFPLAKVGFSKAMSLGWVAVDKASGAPKVIRKVEAIEDMVQKHLKEITTNFESVSNQIKQDYKKRKLISEIVLKHYIIKPGKDFSTSVSKQETDLTPEMIASGSWKTKQFKAYNLNALGTPITRGHLHPLMKVRAEYRQIFLEMGFTEMHTNNFVESSFWNFDALFQPQQHPARDAHDTFFTSDPSTTTNIPPEYMERVKKVHSEGGFGSIGYGYDWKIEEAQKNLLRTHTTAVSARMLYNLCQGGFKPVKYFSIDRVFRNESLDATHLAEFHQIEGVVADYGLTLGDLIGILYEFFRKLGMEKLRFKPAYNPYTEPSMEIFSYHEGLGKWVEIGNSGIFRPEMLLPMGLPEDVSVIAWGLSLERPTMIKYKVDNIRDLVGPKVDLQMVADNPLCRLESVDSKNCSTDTQEQKALELLEQRADVILSRLESIRCEVQNLKKQNIQMEPLTLVIEADPAHPPQSVRTLLKLISSSEEFPVNISVHCHSSLKGLPTKLDQWLIPVQSKQYRIDNQLNLTWIWKDVGPVLVAKQVNRLNCGEICGEASIARLLARLAEAVIANCDLYENFGPLDVAQIDEWVDLAEQKKMGKRFETKLAASEWLVGGKKSLADIFVAGSIEVKSTNNQRLNDWVLRSSGL